MGTLEGLLARFCEEDGYIEKASALGLDSKTANKGAGNYTKYSRDVNALGLMGCQGQPWCCTFQFALEAYEFGRDIALSHWNMTKNSYTGYNCFLSYSAFQAAGKTGMLPREGALVIFHYSHAGRVLDIYEENGKTWFHCCEGNTSSDLNDRNGGQVRIKARPADDPSIKGFCYIDYGASSRLPASQDKRSGWRMEDGGWRFYLGDTGKCVRNDWYCDGHQWAWFDGNGMAVHDTWYSYKNCWYYFDSSCYMAESRWISYKGRDYYLQADGVMAANAYVRSKDPEKDVYYFVDENGVYVPEKDTRFPDLTKYPQAV
ncbi:MAG TPA: hypothetical protein IAA07_12685 [Candidatus Lachnoclostridium stercoravium]|uniref:Uncharacterized protein n=1 Tax=Candidatus Lachnoclostridium stercoravium TaxID=2838633 RepID=A0A9D2HIR7_9FIRM|nr:hypothetical protein [Candidatus Lachnoclostridium stercoravium]